MSASPELRQPLMALRSQRGLLNPDPSKVSSVEAFNAHLEAGAETLLGLRVEAAEPEPAEETAPELDLRTTEEEPKDPKHETPGRDRGTAGGHARTEDEG